MLPNATEIPAPSISFLFDIFDEYLLISLPSVNYLVLPKGSEV